MISHIVKALKGLSALIAPACLQFRPEIRFIMAEAPAAAMALREAALRRFGADALEKAPYFAGNGAWASDVAGSAALARAAAAARVFYLPNCVPGSDVARYLTDTPAIAVSGDRHMMLQDGSHTGSPNAQLPGLLSWEERRRSRKKAIISLEKAYATGGYRAPLVAFPKPRWTVVVSVAGPQVSFCMHGHLGHGANRTGSAAQHLAL